jgi:hypothetical protein
MRLNGEVFVLHPLPDHMHDLCPAGIGHVDCGGRFEHREGFIAKLR